MKQSCVWCLWSVFLVGSVGYATEPLHSRVDRLVAQQQSGEVSALTGDAEFVRRVYLDFIGRIPAADEVKTFLASTDHDKRELLIDHLLGHEEYATHMANVLNVMLMERRGEHDQWERFLIDACRKNKPWHQLVREILNPDMNDAETRGSAFFYTKRLERYGQNPNDMPGLVRDVGRLFLGIDLQCAQCHDHLFVDDYEQADWQGIFAFVGNTSIRKDTEFPAVAESPLLKRITFASVFNMQPMEIGPRLPGGEEAAIPVFKRGEEYVVPPNRKTKNPGTPKFSTLELLSRQLPTSGSSTFSRNAVNRFWWMMTGRGLVEPLDMHHSDNPASHPELLALLSDEFIAQEFDIKWLLREIALTETYQRSSLLPDGLTEPPSPESYRTALERPLSAEQILQSMLQATQEAIPATGNNTNSTDDQVEASGEQFNELKQRFREAFANPPKEPEIGINPTVKAALFLLNDDVVQSWLERREGNLIDRLLELDDNTQVAAELCLAILSRPPAKEELEAIESLLGRGSDARERALRSAAWALLASAEFSVNH